MQTFIIFCRCEDKISLRFYWGVRSVWEKEVYTGLYPRNVRRSLASFNADTREMRGKCEKRRRPRRRREDITYFIKCSEMRKHSKQLSWVNYWRNRLEENDKTVRICWMGELTWMFCVANLQLSAVTRPLCRAVVSRLITTHPISVKISRAKIVARVFVYKSLFINLWVKYVYTHIWKHILICVHYIGARPTWFVVFPYPHGTSRSPHFGDH
jgi:hypothetical protein